MIQKSHSDDRPFLCDNCGQWFDAESVQWFRCRYSSVQPPNRYLLCCECVAVVKRFDDFMGAVISARKDGTT